MNPIYSIALLPLAFAALAGEAKADDHEAPRTLSVTGQGKATATPDLAMMNFAVVSQGNMAGEAITQNSAKMNKVRDALKALNIEARDMQTSGFYLNPRYERDERGRTNSNKIIGYEAGNTLSIRLRDVAMVGEAIDKAVAAGANSLNGLQFGFQNQDELLEQARRNAVRDARGLAELLAEEADVELGDVMSMSISSYYPQPRMMRMESRMVAADAAPTPIEAGESSLSVTVNMTYELD
ncbi:MAG: SIMPL domain-containing protein [Pseudomonadota bacterium]